VWPVELSGEGGADSITVIRKPPHCLCAYNGPVACVWPEKTGAVLTAKAFSPAFSKSI
jgi:hypothetical protein